MIKPRVSPRIEFFSSRGQESQRLFVQQQPFKSQRERNPINVINVERTLVKRQTLQSIKEFILERNHTNVMSVEKPLVKKHIFSFIGEYTQERNLTNITCGRCFSWKSHLTSHRTVHFVETPFKCFECEKSFTQASNLTKHQKIHKWETSSKCDICWSLTVRVQKKLYKCHEWQNFCVWKPHDQIIHRRVEHYKCSECLRVLSLNAYLMIHIGKKH